ncbi:MAG: CsbD family protein [Opitutaceae bacterium]|jgi:uncharacterized protein YjbJ (UPF0337 family)
MKPSTHDNIAGTARVISGTIKKEAGKMLGRPKLEAQGGVERADGRLQKKVGEIEKVLDL